MSEKDRLRARFREDQDLLTADSDAPSSAADAELDRWFDEIAPDIVPGEATIEFLMDDAPAVDLPATWRDDSASRWERVAGELDRNTPRVGDLLREARMAIGAKPDELADMLGWQRDRYQRVEDGNSGAALLNADPDAIRALAARLLINPSLLVSAVAMATNITDTSAFGHRPRSESREIVSADASGDRQRLNEWARRVLVDPR